jgi:sodium/hydrogen exchanger 8
MLFMTIYAILGSIVASFKIRFINESGVSILLGIILSIVLYYEWQITIPLKSFHFLYFFVPPIILAEGFNIRKKHLMSTLSYTIVYGYIGTMLNFFILYSLLSLVNDNESLMKIDLDNEENSGIEIGHISKLSIFEILLMAASLSSKDSFSSTLMIDHHAVPILHSMVFGEGIVNDAAALCLFETIHES